MATAAEESLVYRLPGPVYRGLIETYPEFTRATLQHFCGRLREAGCEGCSRADDVGSRLAGKILTLGDKFGDAIPVTRKELAELSGTTVETAIRVTREFEKLGWLRLARGQVTIKDRAALKHRTLGTESRVSVPGFPAG